MLWILATWLFFHLIKVEVQHIIGELHYNWACDHLARTLWWLAHMLPTPDTSLRLFKDVTMGPNAWETNCKKVIKYPVSYHNLVIRAQLSSVKNREILCTQDWSWIQRKDIKSVGYTVLPFHKKITSCKFLTQVHFVSRTLTGVSISMEKTQTRKRIQYLWLPQGELIPSMKQIEKTMKLQKANSIHSEFSVNMEHSKAFYHIGLPLPQKQEKNSSYGESFNEEMPLPPRRWTNILLMNKYSSSNYSLSTSLSFSHTHLLALTHTHRAQHW